MAFKKTVLIIGLLLISFLCLAGVSAEDSDSFVLEQDSSQDLIQEDSIALDSIGGDDDKTDLITNEVSEEDPLEESSDVLISSEKSKSNVLSSADLELDNDADKENIKVGEMVSWILEAKNFGPDIGKNVKVYNKLPSGMEFVDYTATKGTFDHKTGIWDLGDLEAGQMETLSIIAKALSPGEKVNKANLTSDTPITNSDECYEEEAIDVLDNNHYKKDNCEKTVYSKQLPTVGNPILLLVLSSMSLLIISIKKD